MTGAATPPSSDTPFVHPTAIVEEGSALSAGVRVWHHAHVRAGATIGRDSQVGKNVYVDSGAIIGARCKIQNNVSIYDGVVLGDDVFVGPSAVFTNDLNPRAFGDWLLSRTEVADGASIGANATIVCGHRLGRLSMVAAGAVVARDVLDHQLVGGNPARPMGWVCRCGAVVSRAESPPDDLRCQGCR